MCFALITDRRVGLAGLNYDRIFIKHCLWEKKKKNTDERVWSQNGILKKCE